MRSDTMNDERDDETAPTSPVDARGDDELGTTPMRGGDCRRTAVSSASDTNGSGTGRTGDGAERGYDDDGRRKRRRPADDYDGASWVRGTARGPARSRESCGDGGTAPPTQATAAGDDDGHERRG
ncbi:hypothetical protein PF005_g12879 [Phytophthora fragariae]|nr:hypothetical protein PF005_g12879 [Phytophthora fragariae]